MTESDIKLKIENLERSIHSLDIQYRIVDCKFIQDSYMRQRDMLDNKLLVLKKLLESAK
jgi:hypothetical protein